MKEQEIKHLLQKQQYSFQPYFADRVLRNIEQTATEKQSDFSRMLDYLFPRMSLGMGLGILIVFIFAYFSHGTLDIDTITGLDTIEKDLFNTGYNKLY